MHRHGKGQDTALGMGADGIGTFLQGMPAHDPRARRRRSVRQQGRERSACACIGRNSNCRRAARLFRDTTASAAPVGQFYYGVYHTLVVAPATSNTVAKLRGRYFRHPRHQRLRAGRKVPRPGDRVRLRHRARTRDRSAQGHGQGLSAPHRSRQHRTAEVVRETQRRRVARRAERSRFGDERRRKICRDG